MHGGGTELSDLGTAETFVLVIAGLAALAVLRTILVRETDPVIARLIAFGLLAKLTGSMARYTVMAGLYDGRGDFMRYFSNGVEIARQIRLGSLPDQARSTGTPFMDFLTGVVYVVVPNQLWVGFVVFSLLSFVGAYLFLQAFRLAMPEGNHRRYAALIFFLPTMVFWPSSIGKDAWLVFTLGVAAYGGSRVLSRARFGYLIAALGGAGAFAVRPHMGALFAVSLAAAYVLRFRDTTVQRGVAAWVLGLVIVGAGAGYAAANFGDELPRDESVEGTTTDQIAAETARRTETGDSEFESRPVRGLSDFWHAAVTVPFRPFPTEGHNRQAQLAGLEGLLLLLLLIISIPRLRSLPRQLLRRPYLALASAYCVGFIIAFSNVGNFGILTRQRSQLLPFLAVLLALPKLQTALGSRHRRGRRPLIVGASRTDEQHDDAPARTEHPDLAAPVELVVDLPAGAMDEEAADAPKRDGT